MLAWHTRFGACVLALLVLGGCASPSTRNNPTAGAESRWQGRLSVKVYSKPVQAFSANFELQGQPTQGTLVLSSPLGTTLASMQWDAQSATLTANGKRQQFDSLQALALQATGAELPVANLFAWLQGRAEVAPGWEVDLTELPDGRIQARHVEEVQSELKIILDR